MKESLDFSEFSPSSMDHWMKILAKELGDKPYDFLKWSPFEGSTLEPYYTQQKRIFRTVSSPEKNIKIAESFLLSELHSDKAILESLENGVNHINLVLDEKKNLTEVTAGVFFNFIHTSFHLKENDTEQGCEMIDKFLLSKSGQLSDYSISIRIPLISYENGQLMSSLSALLKSSGIKFKPFVVDTSALGHYGVDAALQVSLALSSGRRILDFLINEENYHVDDALAAIGFHFATSTGYFQEISKYLVFRTLWSTVANAYKPMHACSHHTEITSVSSLFTYSSIDVYNNMLRATSQSMSAVLGQTDSIEILAYDGLNHASKQGRRWARNIMHLLIEESNFNESRNAAEGAFFINQLNCEMAEIAWEKFKELEALDDAAFKQRISFTLKDENARQKEKFNRSEKPLVGVNKFPNKMEVLVTEPAKEFSFRAAFDIERSKIEEGKA